MTIKQKVVSACLQIGISQTELAHRLGMSQQNFSKRLKVGKFSDSELQDITEKLLYNKDKLKRCNKKQKLMQADLTSRDGRNPVKMQSGFY